jgi:hypothetical protein
VCETELIKRKWCSPCEDPPGRCNAGLLTSKESAQTTGGPSIVPSSQGTRRTCYWPCNKHQHRKRKRKTGITIMHWNAEGIQDKKIELENFMHHNAINICCIQETHLQDGKPFKIRGYQVFRNDRQGRKKGGVMTLIRNNINASEIKRWTGKTEYTQTWITTTTCTLDLVNYYCPNDTSLDLDRLPTTASSLLETLTANHKAEDMTHWIKEKRR